MSLLSKLKKNYFISLVLVTYLPPVLYAEQRLTNDGTVKQSPTFIDSNGQEIAYVVQESPSVMRLMKINLSSGRVAPISPEFQNNEFEPAFSRDGKWMATVQSRGNLSLALVMRQFPTGNTFEVNPDGGFCGFRSPAFSADGEKVFYSFADDDRQLILVVDRDGKNRKRIIDGPGHANWPSVSPDGKQLVFSSTRDGNYEIYSSRSDGTEVRRLTDNPLSDIRPKISPDGKRIVFTSSRDGNSEVYVMGLDGSSPSRVTTNIERDDYADWHPNSRQLVIVSERAGKHDLFLVDVE